MKAYIFLFLAAISFSISKAAAQAAGSNKNSAIPTLKGLTVQPAALSFNLDKGQTKTVTVTLINTTDTTYQLATSFIDWTRDTLGKHVYNNPGIEEQSCSRWITFDKEFIQLPSGTQATVAVTLSIPDSAKAVEEMKWSMLLFTTVAETTAPVLDGKVTIQTNQSIAMGVHVLQTPPNIKKKEVKMLNFTEHGKNVYRIISENTGGTQLSCLYSLELASIETGKKTSLVSDMIPLFPRQERYVDFQLPQDLPKGKYNVVALIDAQDDTIPIEATQKEIEIK